MTLELHLHQVLGVLGSRVVNTTLSLLLSLPATRSLVLSLSNGLGRVPVTNALIATVEELVVGHIVLLNVLLDLVKGPVGHGVDLDEAGLVDFDDVEVTTLATLAATAASKNGVDIHLTVGTLSGLNLSDPVVELVVGLPELGAVLGFEFGSGVDASGLIDVHIVVGVLATHTVNQGHGLIEVVQSIEEDEINHLGTRHLQLRQHVQGDKTCETKGSGLEEMRKRSNAPFQDLCKEESDKVSSERGVIMNMGFSTNLGAQGIATGG